ncbi:MAG: hypothetical protein KBS70_03665 [Bacteroidales bacterium]|nr:hypothetical protein [Candidatus Colicola equi]
MKKVLFTSRQIKQMFGVELVNMPSFRKSFYRYMPLSRVLPMLQKQELTFASPALWADPYEQYFLETDYSAFGYIQPKIYCACFRNDQLNEEASWYMYTKGKEPTIKVTFDVGLLLRSLYQRTQLLNIDMYLSKVVYLSTDDIQSITSNPMMYHQYFDKFNERQYVRLMSLKRTSFAYENERRLFLFPRNQDDLSKSCISIPFDIRAIQAFSIAPQQAFISGEDTLTNEKCYNDKCTQIIHQIKPIIDVPIRRSRLYTKIEPIKQIIPITKSY